MYEIVVLLVIGAVTGTLAGLLGIGGALSLSLFCYGFYKIILI